MTRLPLVVVALLVAVVACTNPERPSVQAEPVSLPTPLASAGASASATIGRLRDAVASVPARLVDPVRAYRPSEPQSLLEAARIILRADLADPDDGFVVIYDLTDAEAARTRAPDLATYLGSGFGQTNYPVDAQFSVAVLADTIVFTWWSRSRSDDPEEAEAVFDAIADVGERVEVLK